MGQSKDLSIVDAMLLELTGLAETVERVNASMQ
jgi:hypothetical protein